MSLISAKITANDLTTNANQSVYGLKDFRSMVNYENKTNKGYVRFTKGDDGKLSIEKFNNKVDVPLSWRSNTKPGHNKAIREALAKSLSSYTKYLDAAKAGEIRDLVLNPKVGDHVDTGKALSRVELRKIFEQFDKTFNSNIGRHNLINSVIQKAMVESGYDGLDQEVFMKEYLQCEKHGITKASLLDFMRDKTEEELTDKQKLAGGVAKLRPDEKMFKSDKEFLALIVQIDNLAVAAKMRATMVNSCKSIARELVNNPAAYADPTKNNAHVGEIRAALIGLMQEEHLADVNLGVAVGGGNPGLETFIGTILPAMIRQAVENALELGDAKDPASIDNVLESTLNVETIFNIFKDFLRGAQEAVDKVSEADGQKLAQNLMGKLNSARDTYCKVEVRGVAVQAAQAIQFRDFGVASKLVNDVQQQLTMPIIKEVALENYAIDYIANTFGKVAPETGKVKVDSRGVPLEGAIVKKAEETVTNLKIAGQLVWGVLGEKSANVEYKNGSFIYAESANKFLYEMEKKAVLLTNAVKGGFKLYQRLLSGPIANIMNAKIANAKAGGINANLNIGETSYQAAFNQMEAARNAWKMFMDEKVEVLTAKARTGFISHLNYLVKRGNITADDRSQLLADYDSRMREAVTNAVNKFFHEKTPLPESDKIEEMAKDGLNILVNIMKEERGNVMNDMKERIAIMVATNRVPVNHRRVLFDVPARIKECRESLAKAKVKINGEIDEGTFKAALSKIWYKVLAERFASHKVSHGDNIDYNDFILRTESEFVAQAKKFIKGYNAALAKIDKEVRELAASCIENELFEHKNFVYYKQELSKKEFETLCKSMTDDLVLARKPMIDALKLRAFEHPDAYTKADITEDSISGEMFIRFGEDFSNSDKNRYGVYARLALKRGMSVEGWIDQPNGPNGKTDLATDLTANFSRRLSSVNMIDGKDGAKVVDPKNDNRKVVEAAKDIPMLERGNIIKNAIKEVLELASKYSLSYATGGRAAFLERVEREVRERVDARILEYSKFRREFMPLTKPILEKYSAFGEKTLNEKLDSVLLDQSNKTSWTKAKSFAVAFDGKLNKELNEKITMQGEEFAEYANKIEKIYDKCVTAFNNKVAALEQQLRDAGATDDDLAYMRNTLLPAMRSKLDADIQKDPEAYARVKNGNDFGILLAELKAESVVGDMKSALEDIQIDKRQGLVATLYSIGLREFAGDDDILAVTQKAIDTWKKGENAEKTLADARRGAMLLAAYGTTAVGTAVDNAKAAVETFKKALWDVLVGVRTSVLEGQFNAEQVEPAVALFKTWLARYNLPNITVVSDEFGSGTIETLAIAHFKTRIATMQKKLAEATMQERTAATAGEALLSAEYVTSLVQFINNVGLSSVIAQKQSELIQARRDEIVGRPENKDIYDLSDAGNLPLDRMTVKQMNNYGLTNFLIHTLDQAKTALSEKITTMESLGRWGEEIDKAFYKAYEDNAEFFNEYEDFARRRVSMMSVIDEESSDAKVDALLTKVLKDHFGVDILAQGALSEKFMKDRGADFNLFVKGIKNLCYTMVGAKVMALKGMAVSAPKPGDNLQRLPINGVDDGKGGKYDLLTDVFESAVRSVVISETLSTDKWTKGILKGINDAIVDKSAKKIK